MGMEMESNTLLRTCDWGLTESSLFILAPDSRTAKNLKDDYLRELAKKAFQFRREETRIYYPGCKNRPYLIPVAMAGAECLAEPVNSDNSERQMEPFQHSNLLGADYIRIHEFLLEQKQNGNIVIITSNVTRDANDEPISTENPQAGRDICHHTSDLLLPSRAHWSARQFSGYNYRLSWRRDRHDYSRLNPEYIQLKEILARDGYAPDYEYTLYRPDGAWCRYSTTYFLCRDYLGDEVRIGVSRPQDWQLIEPAEPLKTK